MKKHKRTSDKRGQIPGSLIHIGETQQDAPHITSFTYNEDHYKEEQLQSITAPTDTNNTHWINIDGIHHTPTIEAIGTQFGVHPLVLEDILNTEQRPKTEDYETYHFTVLKMLRIDPTTHDITTEHISLLLFKNLVISLQEHPGDLFEPIRERIRTGKGRIRKMHTDYLYYLLLDYIVDHYFVILETLGNDIDELEGYVLTNPTSETLNSLYEYKRQLIHIRRTIWPLREIINTIQRNESKLLTDDIQIFLRDLYDHTIQIIDTIESYRDTLSGMMDIYLSSVSNKTNDVMKILTIFASIFIPLTFIAGIYGMNFEYMPELSWTYGYPLVWLSFLITSGLLVYYFKKKQWL